MEIMIRAVLNVLNKNRNCEKKTFKTEKILKSKSLSIKVSYLLLMLLPF